MAACPINIQHSKSMRIAGIDLHYFVEELFHKAVVCAGMVSFELGKDCDVRVVYCSKVIC